MSQEIQEQLHKQQEVIADKQMSVKEDLDKVEPAVIEAQNGTSLLSAWAQLHCVCGRIGLGLPMRPCGVHFSTCWKQTSELLLSTSACLLLELT